MNERRIKTQIMLHYKFFSALLHNITFKKSTEVPTAGINKVGTLFYNEEFMDKHTEKEQIFIILHEILHAAFAHPSRIFQMRREYWQIGNIAGDYLVNEVIVGFGLTPPKGLLFNKEYSVDKYTLEELVKELLKNAVQVTINLLGMDCQNNADGADKKAPSNGQDTEAEKKFEQKMKQSLITATEIAKKAGNLPGSIERALKELLQPATNWKRELQDWFNVKIKSERSWHRPNRRFIRESAYLPTKYFLGCGHIGIGVDVSGSIQQKDLDLFGSELNYIFSTCKPTKITVVYFDSEVRKIDTYDELPITLTACGGGGTDFAACFDKFTELATLDEQGLQGVVFMSDGYCSWPEEPNYPVVMLSTTRKTMPFGKTVYVDTTKE